MEQRPKCKRSQTKTGVNLHDLELGVDFLGMTPKVQATKEKIHKLDFTKIKNLCFKRHLHLFIKKIRRQYTEWEKIFANQAPYKALESRIYKELNNLIIKR